MKSAETYSKRILVYGICVSRDIFNFNDGNLFLVDYFEADTTC
jgi:hypothetical protein